MPDQLFDRPYVDVDEWRDEPTRHRYVHGGFQGTDTRFSVYLPPPEQYEGRFFQHITPVPDSEHLAQSAVGEEDKISFSIASGAYFLETNGGGAAAAPGSGDPSIGAFRANAAAAEHSRRVAAEMYGDHRPFGYAYGGSGGGYRTIGGAENTTGVWDGFVPYVIGSPMAIPNCFTVRMHAQRVLCPVLDDIVDAVEPGGSGDLYEQLDERQREALVEATRMGFPLRSWYAHRTMGLHAFPVLYGGLRAADTGYFEDFWTEPGYLGHDAAPSLSDDVVEHRCEISELLSEDDVVGLGVVVGRQAGQARGGVDTAWLGADEHTSTPVAVRLTGEVPAVPLGAELVVETGSVAGQRLGLLSVRDGVAVLGPADEAQLRELRPGDEVTVDNRGYLAAQTYHRHQVPGPEFRVWDQFRHADGTPKYPQRPLLLGPLFAKAAAGTVQRGNFAGKMIVVACLLDREAFPWQADWYHQRVQEHHGAGTEGCFRLWFVDNAVHGDGARDDDPIRTVSYLGVLHQALRDVSAWVERAEPPPTSTRYEVVDGQVEVPAAAADRRGVQPVVTLTVDGSDRADVEPGQEVTLQARVEVPPGTGRIVSVEWDLDGSGSFRDRADVAEAEEEINVECSAAFDRSGVHFPAVRVASERHGDTGSRFARIRNVARVRVVVT